MLNFNDFDTDENFDFVYIYDGWNESASLIASITGLLPISPTGYISSQRYMLVQFATDISVVSRGFNATFTTLSTNG